MIPPLNSVLCGDCIEVMKTFDNACMDCCVTSPPYYGLRDYGVAGQIGLEQTPAAYVERMVSVFEEVRRVLKPDGTCWLNIGDSYSSSSSSNGGYSAKSTLAGFTNPDTKGRQAAQTGESRALDPGCKPKDLLGIPWQLAFALRDAGWYLRRDIIWSKPNPMPESVTDRPTSAHEYLFLLTKSASYHFDADAIREDYAPASAARYAYEFKENESQKQAKSPAVGAGNIEQNPAGRNSRSVWTFCTAPYPGAHFATFPPELPRRCILAGCRPGGIVLDPFAGSGTTGMVATQLGRQYVLIELNPDYLPLIRARTAQQGLAFEVAA